MDNIKQLNEQRQQLAAEIKDLAERQNEWSVEDREVWERVNAAYDDNQGQLDAEKERLEVSARANEVAEAKDIQQFKADRETREINRPVNEVERRAAFLCWARFQQGLDTTEEQRQAAKRCGVNWQSKHYDIGLPGTPAGYSVRGYGAEYRAQATTSDSVGGALIPEGFSNELERALLSYGGPRRVARIIRTSSGNPIPWPTVNDSSNKGQLLSENAAISETAVTFGSETLNAYKYSSDSVLVSAELMQDSFFDLSSEIGSMLGERLGRITSEHFTTGTGSSQPEGVVVGSVAGVTAASATAIAADELIELVHSVDPAYRESAGWMMHDNVILAIRKLKDSDGQYLWQPGLQASEPDRLLGKPVVVNQDMASSIATTAKTVLFGDFSRFIIRDVANVRLMRLDERYADYDQTGFIAFSRHDSVVLDAGSNPIKHLVQA